MKNMWAKASPQRKKTTVMIAAIGVVGVVSWGLVAMTQDNSVGPRKNARPVSHELLTVRDPKSLGIDGLKAEIDQIKKQLREVIDMNRDIQSRAANQPSSASSAAAASPDMPASEDMTPEDRAALERIRNAPNANAPAGRTPAGRTPSGGSRQGSAPRMGNQAPSLEGAETTAPSGPAPYKLEIKSYGEKEEEDGAKVAKKDEYPGVESVGGKKNAKNSRFVLPAGAIMEGVLLTGLDAPTASHARQNPFPALVRIKHEALLPNRWRTDIRECFVMASGYGDLASERAYLRAEAISCVRDDGTIMESTMDGFASGEDGKNGIRGRLVSKQGQMMAQALMGGFLQGIANIYKPARVPQLTLSTGNGSTGTDSYNRPDPSMALEEGIAGGMQTAAKAVADFYIDMARNTFPIIEIDAGRKVSFIVGRSVNVTSRNAMQQQQRGGMMNSTMNYMQNGPVGRAVNQVMGNGQAATLYQP